MAYSANIEILKSSIETNDDGNIEFHQKFQIHPNPAAEISRAGRHGINNLWSAGNTLIIILTLPLIIPKVMYSMDTIIVLLDLSEPSKALYPTGYKPLSSPST